MATQAAEDCAGRTSQRGNAWAGWEVALGMMATFAGAWLTWTDSHKPVAWPVLTFSGVALTLWGAVEWANAHTNFETLRLQREQQRP